MKNRLSHYCSQKRPAIVTMGDTGTVFQSRFADFTGWQVVLDLVAPVPSLASKESTPVTVVFTDHQRHGLFVSPLEEIRQSTRPYPQIALGAPLEIVQGDARRSFRIPLHPETALAVRLERADCVFEPTAVDISVAGILLDFGTDSAPDFATEETVTVRLELTGQKAQLESFVGRTENNQVAVYFSQALRELRRRADEVPSVLESIVNELEREYLEKSSRN